MAAPSEDGAPRRPQGRARRAALAPRLDRLRVTDVQRWLNRLPTQCQCCAQGKDAKRSERGKARCCAVGKCCKAVPSARTIKDVRAVLRPALTSAMREEFVARNVAELVTTPKQRKRKIVPWSSEEARRFLESARADKDVMYAAFVLILVLGLRKGEVLGLHGVRSISTGVNWSLITRCSVSGGNCFIGRPRQMPQTPLCRCRRLSQRR